MTDEKRIHGVAEGLLDDFALGVIIVGIVIMLMIFSWIWVPCWIVGRLVRYVLEKREENER